jgi:hypothetical protein
MITVINNKLKRMWKEVTGICEVSSWHLPGRTEVNYEKPIR